MNPGDVAPLLAIMTVTLTTGGVILFRPLTKRLAELLQAMAEQRLSPGSREDAERTRELVATLEARIALLEERQRFTDLLLEKGGQHAAPRPLVASDAHPDRSVAQIGPR